ncbi:aminotransferase class I/II-fold pyridoxal phosphate-dependent enzyme [Haloglomus salinum]|uniref:aminotransferase class I/II-fold pyridoxal phosphate-dependent enzyme n=1 Tax=Haloglomus salinum TaxID=2962673 RepID=UPI0020C99DC7|nr:aminotransferase class I/II-fold pyridoxal phosphate-dependent enzyme [Haloglomus salinum]
MQIEPFALERWFATHEADNLMLAESGIRPLDPTRFDLVPDDFGYVIPTGGDPDLRGRIGDRYDRAADEVLLTCGTQEANFVTFAALMGDHAVVVTPTYQSLHAIPEALGEVTRVELDAADGWRLDPDAVAEAIRPDTALVVLNNPNNPTGRIHDADTVRAVYEHAADAGAYLLCDEVYRPFAGADDGAVELPPPAASLGPYGVSTCGLSKGYGLAGLRFGWLAGPREVVEAAAQWKDYTTISPPAVSQRVAEQVLDPETEAEILAENRDLAARNRDLVGAFVDRHDLGWPDPETGVNAFIEVPDGFFGGQSFCERVVEECSVVLAPGEAFDQPDYFRLGFGDETAHLEEGLERLDGLLERHA